MDGKKRDMRSLARFESVTRDCAYAFRCLRRTPSFTVAAVLSLALGVGCNVAIFSLVNSLLLRPLPVDAPQRLFLLAGGSSPNGLWPVTIWDEIQKRSEAFESVAAWASPSRGVHTFSLTTGQDVQPVEGMFVSGDYFSLLGVHAWAGRTIEPTDDAPDCGAGGPVAVVSHRFLERHFGGGADTVGRIVTLNQIRFTIIGVAPPDFFGTEVGRFFDVAVPIACEPLLRGQDSYLELRAAFWLNIVLRLKPDRSPESATSFLRTVQSEIREVAVPPGSRSRLLQEPLILSSAETGTSALREQYRRPVLTLLAVSGLVLLVACANVANLLFTRGTSRSQEISVRVALGAGARRLAQQHFVESLLLAGSGTVVGIGFAVPAVRLLMTQLPGRTSVSLAMSPDWRVIAFAVASSVVTAVVFGTAPALRAARTTPGVTLRAQGRGAAGSRSATLGAAVVVQVALSVVLMVAASLFIQTFRSLASVQLGFDPSDVIVVQVNASRSTSPLEQRMELFQRLSDAVAEIPAIRQAAGSATTPLSGGVWGGKRVEVSGGAQIPDEQSTALINFVTPGWFATYGTPLVAGRDIDRSDSADSQQVAVVNEAFVRRFTPDDSVPLGATITLYPDRSERIIVGIVGDAVYGSMRELVRPTLYVPLLQYKWANPFSNVTLSVLPQSGARQVAAGVSSALTAIDPNLSFTFTPLAEQVQSTLSRERIAAIVSGFMGLLSVTLAAIGLYGVASYSVSRRRGELGIRIALGAVPVGLITLVMRQVILLVAIGVAVGGVISVLSARSVEALLYGVGGRDPTTLVSAGGLLFLVGAMAAFVPAWNAVRVHPSTVLRDD